MESTAAKVALLVLVVLLASPVLVICGAFVFLFPFLFGVPFLARGAVGAATLKQVKNGNSLVRFISYKQSFNTPDIRSQYVDPSGASFSSSHLCRFQI
jgi:hypothetical protein